MATSNDPMFNMMAAQLKSFGLGALFEVRPDGSPGGWLWDQIKQGFDSSEKLMMALEATDVYRDRFGVIIEQQARAARGEVSYVMSPAEVLEYENRAKQVMTAAGMPSWFYDDPSDFNQLILSDISPVELERRVTQAFEYVDNAPAEVRSKFEEFYGVAQGDKALAAYVLDPSRTVAALDKATRTAYTAGMAKRFDLEVSKTMAERIADLPRTEAGIVQGLEAVSAQSRIYEEMLFEDGDITVDDGFAAEFEGDADARGRMERRKMERSVSTRASTGGAVVTNKGLTGAGNAGGR